MPRMKEISDYGPCCIVSITCPANGHDLPRKTTLFEVCENETYETLDAFRTARQAKKFARRYIADPEGTLQRQRMLSGDRLTHVRALWAVVLLSNWVEFDVAITDNRNPHAEPERYEASDIFVNSAENAIILMYYPSDTATRKEIMYISRIKAVRAISESTFTFETYQGKTFMIGGID